MKDPKAQYMAKRREEKEKKEARAKFINRLYSGTQFYQFCLLGYPNIFFPVQFAVFALEAIFASLLAVFLILLILYAEGIPIPVAALMSPIWAALAYTGIVVVVHLWKDRAINEYLPLPAYDNAAYFFLKLRQESVSRSL